jgi:TolB-like protein
MHMHSESRTGSAIAFGPFTLDLNDGELRRNGLRLRLQPQARRLLLVLASRPGQVATRQEIRDRLWGADTCIDFEHALNYSVCQLRAALRDTARRPRYIETLPKRGYRFIAQAYRLHSVHDSFLNSRTTLGEPSVEKTLAVLPYHISAEAQQSIADGMTDCLIAMLSKIVGLRVIPAGSVMHLKGKALLLNQLAFTLDANWVVEGRILVAGKRIRISTQLVDAPLGTILWSEQHEGLIRSVLSLQNLSSQQLTDAVSFRMRPRPDYFPADEAQEE